MAETKVSLKQKKGQKATKVSYIKMIMVDDLNSKTIGKVAENNIESESKIISDAFQFINEKDQRSITESLKRKLNEYDAWRSEYDNIKTPEQENAEKQRSLLSNISNIGRNIKNLADKYLSSDKPIIEDFGFFEDYAEKLNTYIQQMKRQMPRLLCWSTSSQGVQ